MTSGMNHWHAICALVSSARAKGNGFAYYTGELGWMLGSHGDINEPWDYQLVAPRLP